MAEKTGFAKKTTLLLLFISAGLVAYGFGLYQGNKFRLSRSVASEPSVAPVPLNNHDSTQSQK